ncbi:unnamed protein product [Brassicogethes aeneus]|uniref:Uncharacterized protein n=1 Tax=Brassicogethes aeneus TaxID=1431903 RepID=A0A9P0FDT7_BRAAE|nr:unnamed protein product [Brassicogethes aeneus]
MSSVRWKNLIFLVWICIAQAVTEAARDKQHMQDTIAMTADGWRPIVGQGRRPTFNNDEITQYRNPIGPSEVIKKAETPGTPATTLSSPKPTPKMPTKATHGDRGNFKKFPKSSTHGQKMTTPSQIYHGGSHGPHIPLERVPVNRPGPNPPPVKKYPANKFQNQHGNGKKRKPTRGQLGAYSTRDEVFAPPPKAGSYAFISQGANTIKTRDTPGFILGANNFPSSHLEFSNRFPLVQIQNDNSFQAFGNGQAPFQGFQKQTQGNDVRFAFNNQNDEYTRNLVPPPQPYKSFQDKEANKKITKHKEGVTQSTNQIVRGNNQNLQLPPPFSYAQNEVKENNQQPGVEVEVTKQKLKVFHNSIPSNYNPLAPDYVDYDYHMVKRPTNLPRVQTYEVTEGKQYQETPLFYRFQQHPGSTQRPKRPVSRKPQQQLPLIELSRPLLELNLPPFLPTPFKPEGVVPTSPTQEEVSTLFSKVKIQEYQTLQPQFFDVKEVSTHFPILGKPEYHQQEQELTNEITTSGEQETTTLPTTTKEPQRARGSHRRRRPNNKLKITTTTEEALPTESYDVQKMQESETEASVETERPTRRRPNRHRTTTTTEASDIEEPTTKTPRRRNRYRQRQGTNDFLRKKLRTTEAPVNHKMEEDYRESTEESASTEETQNVEDATEEESYRPARTEEATPSNGDEIEMIKTDVKEIIITESPTTEIAATTNIHMPENEVDYSTSENQVHLSSVATEIPEMEEVTLATTTTSTTTTTEEPSTTKSHRVRGRPSKYDSSNRPRFSVKDYRQRFSTTSSTTESQRTTSVAPRLRFPNRSRRPMSSTTTPSSVNEQEEENRGSRFKPKEPRYTITTEPSDNIITEKTVKAVNTRLRPFGGRQRSTTEAPVTVKVSIRPNLFSQRRRTATLSLKNRILSKMNNKTQEVTTVEPEPESEENETEQVTQASFSEGVTTNLPEKVYEYADETTTSDILKNDPSLYSQRVSDLTSSFKNEYNTPGLFKNVSPTSRKIPNHFTISTDDPILPIEAFFPNINKGRE